MDFLFLHWYSKSFAAKALDPVNKKVRLHDYISTLPLGIHTQSILFLVSHPSKSAIFNIKDKKMNYNI